MATTVEDFMESANKEQLRIFDCLKKLGKREHELADSVNKAHKPYWEAAERERRHWGVSFVQISDLVVEQEIAPAGYAAASGYQKKLEKVREEMAGVFREAIGQGMDHLGIIQRHYEHYVGEPIPAS
tara:strand:- start:1578 stop:1958 length:381 start_codon:yes stop_codon:yes gene_type:complete